MGYQDCCGNDDEIYVDTATRITSENLTSAKNAIGRLNQTGGACFQRESDVARGGVFLTTLPSSQGGGCSRHKSAESFVAQIEKPQRLYLARRRCFFLRLKGFRKNNGRTDIDRGASAFAAIVWALSGAVVPIFSRHPPITVTFGLAFCAMLSYQVSQVLSSYFG